MASSNADRLAANGCGMQLAEFKDMLADLMSNLYRSWSVDELLVHPHDAIDFCAAVRRKAGAHDLPDDLILRILMDRRKHP